MKGISSIQDLNQLCRDIEEHKNKTETENMFKETDKKESDSQRQTGHIE